MGRVAVLGVLALSVLLLIEALERSVPLAQFYPMRGYATWYTSFLTATGERLDNRSFSCAMRRRDFGKSYLVCNEENGKCVVVRHNNWGPCWILFARGRIVDLTKTAFERIADLDKGVVKVKISEVRD